jgi:hypothetical protein
MNFKIVMQRIKFIQLLLLSFFYLGGDVILSLLANLGILSYAFQCRPNPFSICSLLTGVSGVYLLDRSYDSLRENKENRTNRGRFFSNKTQFTIPLGWFSILLSGLIAVTTLEIDFLSGAALIALLLAFYFLCVLQIRPRFFPKEFLISIIYCTGAAYPILFYTHNLRLEKYLLLLLLFLSILTNVILLSLLDEKWDVSHNLRSTVQFLGRTRSLKVFYACLSLGIVSSVSFLLVSDSRSVGYSYIYCFLYLAYVGRMRVFPDTSLQKVFLELAYFPFLIYWFL